MNHKTGIDLLNWLGERLRELPLFRQDVPRFGTQAERARFAARLRRSLASRIVDGIVDEFLIHSDGSRLSRSRFQFPELGAPKLTANSLLRYIAPAPFQVREEGGAVVLYACGQKWSISVEAKPLLDRLLTRSPATFDLLCQSCPSISAGLVEDLLRQFIAGGVLEVSI